MTTQKQMSNCLISWALFSHVYRYHLSLVLLVMCFISNKGWCGNDELNLHFLQGGDKRRVSSILENEVRYYPGNYFVEVVVNGISIGKRVLTVTAKEQYQLCFTPEWLANINVYPRPDVFAKTFRHEIGCYVLGEYSDAEINLDTIANMLTLRLPKTKLNQTDNSLDWRFGHNALRLNYTANANKYQRGTDYFGATALLANIGEWVMQGSASLSKNSSAIENVTLSKALLSWQSDVELGKTTIGSGDLGGLPSYGITLSSNQAMRRQTLGYAPIFSGVATSAARVTLRQGTTLLYSELVAPGPFTIDDVMVFTGGDVVMTITESEGTQTQQIFPITLIHDQISPGQHEYSISLGVTDNNSIYGAPSGGLLAANYGYGLPIFSLRTGTLVGNKFLGITGSVTSYLGALGTLSAHFSATQSHDSEGRYQGDKRTLVHAKTFKTGTSIRSSFSQISQFYNTLGEYSDLERQSLSRRQRLKENISISVSQPFWQRSGFSLGVWERRYWDQNGSQQGVNSSFSTQLGQVSLSLSGSYYKTHHEDQYSISTSVSIPFSVFGNNTSAFTTLSSRKNSGNSGLSGASTHINDKWSLMASHSWNNHNVGQQTNLWSAYRGKGAELTGQLTHTGDGTAGSGSITGSLLYLPANNSLILGRNISDTVAVVNVKGVSGATLLGRTDTTDSDGNLIVPLNSYQVNTLVLDPSSLPTNRELTVTRQQVKPTEKSVAYVPFESLMIKRYLLQVRQADGALMPPGVWATNERHVPLGFVGPQGVLLINSLDSFSSLNFPGCHVPASAIAELSTWQEVRCITP